MSSIPAILGSPLAQAIGWALVHLLWQGVLVAAILAAALALLQRRSANASDRRIRASNPPGGGSTPKRFCCSSRGSSETDVTPACHFAPAASMAACTNTLKLAAIVAIPFSKTLVFWRACSIACGLPINRVT